MTAACPRGGCGVADTPRKRVLVAFETALKRIAKGNGYNHDLADVVTRDAAQLDAEEVDSGLAVIWTDQKPSTDAATQRTHRLTTITVVAKVKTATPEDTIDKLADDIEQALHGRPTSWPAGFSIPQYQSTEPLRAPANAGWAGVAVTYTTNIPIR